MQPVRFTGVVVHCDAKKGIIKPNDASDDREPRRLFFPNDIAPGMHELIRQRLGQGLDVVVQYSLRRDRYPNSPDLATDVACACDEGGAPEVDAPTARAAAPATKAVGEFWGVVEFFNYAEHYGFITPNPASGDTADRRFFLATSIRTPPAGKLPVTYSLQRDANPSRPDVAVNVAPREDGDLNTGGGADEVKPLATLAAASAGAGPVNDFRGVVADFDRKKSATAPQRMPEFMPQFQGVRYTLLANTHVPSRLFYRPANVRAGDEEAAFEALVAPAAAPAGTN